MSPFPEAPSSLRLVVKNTFFEWVEHDASPARLTRSISAGSLPASWSAGDGSEPRKSMGLADIRHSSVDAPEGDGKRAADRDSFSTEDTCDTALDSRSAGSFPESPASRVLVVKNTFFEYVGEEVPGRLTRSSSAGRLSCSSSVRGVEASKSMQLRGHEHASQDLDHFGATVAAEPEVNLNASSSVGSGDDESSRSCSASQGSYHATRWAEGGDVARFVSSNQATFQRHVRPCKGKRMRWEKLTSYLVGKAEEDPASFDFGAVWIPGSLAQDTIRVNLLFNTLREVVDKAMAGQQAVRSNRFLEAL